MLVNWSTPQSYTKNLPKIYKSVYTHNNNYASIDYMTVAEYYKDVTHKETGCPVCEIADE